MLLISLISFGAIVAAWIVAPEGKPAAAAQPKVAVPAGAVAARA